MSHRKKTLVKLIKIHFFSIMIFSGLSLLFNFNYHNYSDNARWTQNTQSRRQKVKKVSRALSLSRLTWSKTHGGLPEEAMRFRKLHQKKIINLILSPSSFILVLFGSFISSMLIFTLWTLSIISVTLLSLDEILSRLPGSQ